MSAEQKQQQACNYRQHDIVEYINDSRADIPDIGINWPSVVNSFSILSRCRRKLHRFGPRPVAPVPQPR